MGSAVGILAHLSEPGPDSSVPDPQRFRDLSQAGALNLESNDVFLIYDPTRTAQLLSAFPSVAHSRAYPLANEVTLQLSNSRHNREQRLPEGAVGVDVFLIADELDTERPKFL